MKSLIILIFMLIPSISFAAMTCTGTANSISENKWEVRIQMTFDTTPGTASCALPASVLNKMKGLYLYKIATIPGTVGPTEDTDLQILDSDGVTILSASGFGANIIDNTAVNSVVIPDGKVAGTDKFYPLVDGKTWTATVTNNAVNNSSYTLILVGVD